jgi:hypothetical protein
VILCDSVEFSVVHENMSQIQTQGIDCTFCVYDWFLSSGMIDLIF